MEVKSTIDGNKEIQFEIVENTLKYAFSGENNEIRIIERSEDFRNLILDNKGKKYEIRVLKTDNEKKELILKINGQAMSLKLEDEYDNLLKSMGMGAGAVKKINDLKAPMPGVVLDVKVAAGQEVKKDEPIVVLEAMKMENLLKSPIDGVIKSIEVSKGDTVEKNKVLVNFE